MNLKNSLLTFVCFILIIIIILIYLPMKEPFTNYKIGANAYKIYDHLENPQDAAEAMDKLNRYAKQLIYYLNDKYLNNPKGYKTIKNRYKKIVEKGIIYLTKNYNTASLQENIPFGLDRDTSYVVDKGEIFAMCIRNVDVDNKVIFTDMNEKIFVLIHEMAHLFTEEIGHGYNFWCNFKFLLSEAVQMGIYIPVDYKKNIAPYCGIKISYSPLFDTELANYLN